MEELSPLSGNGLPSKASKSGDGARTNPQNPKMRLRHYNSRLALVQSLLWLGGLTDDLHNRGYLAILADCLH
jgi:hypothetical protein